ncbi:MAG: hypothetical protein ABJI60_06470 [Kangiellaceae bacterium]|jgi:hypothetical protein
MKYLQVLILAIILQGCGGLYKPENLVYLNNAEKHPKPAIIFGSYILGGKSTYIAELNGEPLNTFGTFTSYPSHLTVNTGKHKFKLYAEQSYGSIYAISDEMEYDFMVGHSYRIRAVWDEEFNVSFELEDMGENYLISEKELMPNYIKN